MSLGLIVSLLVAALATAGIVKGAKADKDIIDPFKDVAKKLTGSGLTTADKEKIALEDEYLDENREQEFQMKLRAWDAMDSPLAQMKSNVQAYEYAGLNKMGLAGSGALTGASGGTSGASAGSADSSNGDPGALVGLLSLLLNTGLKRRELDINQQHVDNETKETNARVEGIEIQNANLQDLLDLQKGDLSKKIEFMGQQIETEPVKRALLKTEIGLRQAQTAVQENMAALQKIDLKYHDAYQAAQLGIAQAYRALQETQSKYQEKLLLQQIGLNAKQIEIMNQTIITGKLEAGLLAKQFQYYDSDRKFNRWNTGIGTAVKAVGAVAGLAVGAGSFGKAVGLFGSAAPNRYGYDAAPVGWQ